MTKIFEIGHGHTGTNSLTVAMFLLGYKCAHGARYPRRRQDCYRQFKSGRTDYSLVRQHDFISNWPLVCYRELDRDYPGAKFILPIRDPIDWALSMERRSVPLLRLRRWRKVYAKQNTWVSLFQYLVYGTARYSRDVYLRRFVGHNMEVMRHFQRRPNDLLIIDICGGEGWDLLCPFLDKPRPNVPFPCCRSVADAYAYVEGIKCGL